MIVVEIRNNKKSTLIQSLSWQMTNEPTRTSISTFKCGGASGENQYKISVVKDTKIVAKNSK